MINKKIVSSLLCFAMLFAFAGCKKNANETTTKSETTSEETTQEDTEETSDSIHINNVGGWTINEEDTDPESNEEGLDAFYLAITGLDGVSYEPIALLGTQIVSGTNYCYLCRSTPVVPDATSTFVLVYIYADLEGNAEVTDITDVNI